MGVLFSILIGMDKSMKFLLLLQMIAVIIIIVLRISICRKHKRICLLASFVPLIVFVIFYAFNYIKGNSFMGYQRYAGLFCSSFIICLWGIALYFKKSAVVYSVISSVLVLFCFIETLYVILVANFSPRLTNNSHYGWSESLERTIDELEKSYILRDWKPIDFDDIRSKLIPRVENAEKNNDQTEFSLALYDLKYMLYDGHVWVSGKSYDALNNAKRQLSGNDYGFSMFRDNKGQILAVLTEESSEAKKLGIHDGTQIIKWNEEPVDVAVSKVECKDGFYQFSYIENEEIFKPIFLAGKGGDTIRITFIDDNGNEQTVSINKTGDYYRRLNRAIKKVYGDNIYSDENLYTCMLNDNCGYLRVNSEALYGKNIKEVLAMATGVYPEFRNEMEKKIQKLDDKGMDRIIIDIRNNDGGYDVLSRSIASLFVEKPVASECAYYKNGGFEFLGNPEILGEARWGDIPVAVIVNGETCSAGDCFAYWLSQGENVKLFGNTHTWGNAQTIGGVCILSDGLFELRYPIYPSLSAEGEPIADPKSDRKARIKLDYKITYDKDGVLKLFSDSKEDDILNQVIEYMSSVK